MAVENYKDLWWEGRDGLRLHAYDHGALDASKTLVIVHGYGEHAGRYHAHAARFVQAGYRVIAVDVRGHGKSEGRRGHTMDFEFYLDDLDRLAEQIQTPREATGMLGHSHGGLITLRRSLVEPTFFSVCAVTSPMLGLSVKVPAWKLFAGRLLSKLMPTVSFPSSIVPEHLSHDPAVVAAYATDTLGHKVDNARWFTEAMDAIELVFRDAGRARIPTLVVQSGDDKLVSAEAARQWAGAAPSSVVQYEEVDGAYHELLFELDGATHGERLLRYFESHLQNSDGADA